MVRDVKQRLTPDSRLFTVRRDRLAFYRDCPDPRDSRSLSTFYVGPRVGQFGVLADSVGLGVLHHYIRHRAKRVARQCIMDEARS